MNMKTTYIAYLRQSIQKQEISGLGIEAQREIIQNYLKEKKPVSEYIETEARNLTDTNLRKLWKNAERTDLSYL